MNYIQDTLRRQAAMFAALLGGGERRKEDEEMRTGRRGKKDPESGGDGALRIGFSAEKPEKRQVIPKGMAAWNRRLAGHGEGRLHQATGTRELAVAEIPIAESVEAESPFIENERSETARLNAEKNAVQWRKHDSVEQAFGIAEKISREGAFFGGRGAYADTAGAVPVVNGKVSAGTMVVVDHGMSAGELSRTFQRDARRYDGGYPLY